MTQSNESLAKGLGAIVSKKEKTAFEEGGIIEGKGKIIRKDGRTIDFILSSTLMAEEAEMLNKE